MTNTAKIALIGAGNMGTCLLAGLIAKGYPVENVKIADPSAEKLQLLQQQFQIQTFTNNAEAIATADVILFAVKPNHFSAVAEELKDIIQQSKPLIISIAAGLREASIQRSLGGHIAVVRAMPNTPAMIGCGATALFANKDVTHDQKSIAESIMRSVGITVWLEKEHLLDAATAVSGCGPAYFFLTIEAIQHAGEKLGLTPAMSRLLTLQTAYGAARMALESEQHVALLRSQVASPGGATEQGLRVLEEKNIREIFDSALKAAENRAKELGDQL